MNQRTSRVLLGLLVVLTMAAAFYGHSVAKPAFVSKAKSLGYPAENCLYCHTVKVPKKATAQEELNDRGQWLLKRKTDLKAPEVLVEWLKDYPGGKEQK